MLASKQGGALLSLLIFCGLPILFCGVPASVAAESHPGKTKAEDERCAECHGLDGNIHAPNESAKIPKLAGQSPDYLLKQFQDFRSGERHNDFMAIMARNLEDEEVADIFAWYASQPSMKGDSSVNADNPLGKKLYLEGDAARGILPCAGCHGVDGKGVSQSPSSHPQLEPALIPVIGGQDWYYLDQQLRDWRAGVRTNSQDGLMNKVTKQLSDAEITALNDFISALK